MIKRKYKSRPLDFIIGVVGLSELIKDFRNDMKKLIETLAALNNNLSKLESFADSISRLTRELEESNRNFKILTDLLKDLSK